MAAFLGVLGGVVGMLGATSGRDLEMLNKMSTTDLAKTIGRSLSKTGLAPAGRAAGIGLFIGLICGIDGALLECVMSDTYRDSVGESFGN